MKSKKPLLINLGAVIFVSMALIGAFFFGGVQVSATEHSDKGASLVATAEAAVAEASSEASESEAGESKSNPIKPIAAAIALGLGAIGTAMAQMKIGAAGCGAMAEKPELATMMIVMIAIPETIVILGFVVAAMIVMF